MFGYKLEVPEALTLFVLTMLLLFLPKIVSMVLMLGRRRGGGAVRREGPAGRSARSLEMAVSTLLAPINMMFNSKFVLFTLLGQGVSWVAQKRGGGR